MMSPDEPLFVFRFVNEARDYAAMATAMTRQPVKQGLIIGIVWSAAAVATAYWLSDETMTSIVDNIVLVAPMVVVLIALLAISERINGIAAKWSFRNTAYAHQEATISFSTSGLNTICAGIAAQIDWSTITHIIKTADYAFFAISKREAVIIPRRAAACDNMFHDAIAFARRHIRAAQ